MVNFSKYIRIVPLYLFNERYSAFEGSRSNNLETPRIILLFDVDFCLYNNKEAKNAEVIHNQKWEKELMNEAIVNGCPIKTFKELKKLYYSSRCGIHKFYGKSIDYVQKHDFNQIENYIEEDEDLVEELKSLNCFELYCFTNGFPKRINKVLKKLNVESLFQKIFCSIDGSEGYTEWLSKPNFEAFEFVKVFLNIKDDTTVVFFDDAAENLEVARSPRFKWKTYHITQDNDVVKAIRSFKKDFLENKGNTYMIKSKLESAESHLYKTRRKVE